MSDCLPVELKGSAASCDARCETSAEITACKGGDGCCAQGCDQSTDSDCSARCGDGVLDDGEKCEDGSAKSCPAALADCNDGDPCTVDKLTGSANACSAECAHMPVQRTGMMSCDDGDPCTDDMPIESTDSCTYECKHGAPQTRTPAENCDDGDPCTNDMPVESSNGCSFECRHSAVTAANGGDGCCVESASTADADCRWCAQQEPPAGYPASGFQCVDFDGGGTSVPTPWQPMGDVGVSGDRSSSSPSAVRFGSTNSYLGWRSTGGGDVRSVHLKAELSIARSSAPTPPRGSLCAVFEETPATTLACVSITDNATLKLSWQHCGQGGCSTPFECDTTYRAQPNTWVPLEMTVLRSSILLRQPTMATCEGSYAEGTVAVQSRIDGSSVYFDNVAAAVERVQ